MSTKIALLGDYRDDVLAHRAIPPALELAALSLAAEVEPEWIGSDAVAAVRLEDYAALWCVPYSPYRDGDAVIEAIGHARRLGLPFLGTCAGFQHALLEYARHQLGLAAADSVENNPATELPLITPLACRLGDTADAVNLRPGSHLAEIYQSERIVEEYNCGYGLNAEYVAAFDDGELVFCAHDDRGEARAFELRGPRFFVGTAFQPERSSLQQMTHPLITAFVMAAL